MHWWGLLLILAGVVIIVYSARTLIKRGGAGRGNWVWTGFLGLGLVGLGVASFFGLSSG